MRARNPTSTNAKTARPRGVGRARQRHSQRKVRHSVPPVPAARDRIARMHGPARPRFINNILFDVSMRRAVIGLTRGQAKRSSARALLQRSTAPPPRPSDSRILQSLQPCPPGSSLVCRHPHVQDALVASMPVLGEYFCLCIASITPCRLSTNFSTAFRRLVFSYHSGVKGGNRETTLFLLGPLP